MALDINLTLTDEDLAHFTNGMRQAQDAAKGRDPTEIIAAARKQLEACRSSQVPAFIGERVEKVEPMISMAADVGFGLPDEDRQRVLAVLSYFADPVDFIPDTVPVLGFLDDAIMIELCQQELRHEIEAYEDFVEWRDREARQRGEDPDKLALRRVDWAEARRAEAIERMHRHRRESYVSGSWKPALFRVR